VERAGRISRRNKGIEDCYGSEGISEGKRKLQDKKSMKKRLFREDKLKVE
jgi:hypothetical protein